MENQGWVKSVAFSVLERSQPARVHMCYQLPSLSDRIIVFQFLQIELEASDA